MLLEKSLKSGISQSCREWPYKDVPKYFFVEKFLGDGTNFGLIDYKFFCFNGELLLVKLYEIVELMKQSIFMTWNGHI